MKKHIYITSYDDVFTFPNAHSTKEEALNYTGVKRIVRVEIDIPNIEEEEAVAEDVEIKKDLV